MNHSKNPINQGKSVPDLAIVEQFLKTQHQKALNEAEEIKLKSKELDLHSRYAEKALDHQQKFLASKPSENRKTLTRIGYIVGGIVLLFLGFISFCLYLDKEDFAGKFLQVLSYVLTTGLGYYFGTLKNKKSNSDKDIQEAEIVN
jgi:hypothetical protein